MDLVVEKGIPGTFRFQPSFRTNFFEKDFFLTIVPVRIRFLRNKPTATILDAILQRVKLPRQSVRKVLSLSFLASHSFAFCHSPLAVVFCCRCCF
jgi:hypothetical protein